jgi:hypothetical protein
MRAVLMLILPVTLYILSPPILEAVLVLAHVTDD